MQSYEPTNRISVYLTTVDYIGTKGERIKKYMDRAVVLNPFESTRYVVPQKDKSGGSGTNFIVGWKAEQAVNPLIVESVSMIGCRWTTEYFVYFSGAGDNNRQLRMIMFRPRPVSPSMN